MLRQLRAALVMLTALTALTGIAYPLAVTGIAALAFPRQAEGSQLVRDGGVVGSSLIGQPFSSPDYFWGRPSATGPVPYNAAASGGSNLAPSNPELARLARERLSVLTSADVASALPVPADLVTASGSGLDPHISPQAAEYQVARVARARGLSEEQVRALVRRYTEGRTMGFLGEPRVNVLELNLALDDFAGPE
jgi:K+-transporting ATPase ATPase C chain